MAIHDSNTGAKGTLYRGNYEPAEWFVGNKKITGWKEETQTGTALTFNDTYNDKVLSAKVKGNTVQKSEWQNKEAESSQATGVMATNLITNGDFSNGTTSWSIPQASSTSLVENNTLRLIGTGTQSYSGAFQTGRVIVSGTKVYARLKIRVTNPNATHIRCFYNDNTPDKRIAGIDSPVSGQWYTSSAIITPEVNVSNIQLYHYYADAVSAIGKMMEVQYVLSIDLTDTFGAGNEPTAAQMDAMLAQYPDSWFDGTNWLTTDPAYTANSPSPDYPQPITTTLPKQLNGIDINYRVQDYKGDWYEFTLPSDLHGIGDVRDSVEWDKYDRKGFERRKNLKSLFDGSADENWSLQGTNAHGIIGFIISVESATEIVTTSVGALCSHFQYSAMGLSVATTQSYFVQRSVGSTNLYIRMWQSDVADLAAFKTWLSVNNITVVHTMKTPTRTPLPFTLNNASTAPECPMEFLTSTPSEEYRAEVWDAEGTVSTRGRNLFDMSLSVRYDATKKCLVATSYAQNTNVKLKDFLHGKAVAGDTVVLSGITTAPTKKIIYLGAPYANTWTFGVSRTLTLAMLESQVYIYTETVENPAPTDIYLQVERGSTATPYQPYHAPVTAAIPPIRKVNTVADEYETITGKLTKRISDWITLDGTKDYSNAGRFLDNSTTRIALTLSNYPTTTADVAAVYKYDSTRLPYSNNTVNAAECYAKFANAILYLCVPDAESGWGETINATNDEIGTYFHGWRMCHSDGTTPYTSGTKHWKRIVGTDAEIAASITPTRPAASYAGYTSYKMIHQLATPAEEQHEPATLPTYYPTTVIEITNDTPATATITATVKTVDLN